MMSFALAWKALALAIVLNLNAVDFISFPFVCPLVGV